MIHEDDPRLTAYALGEMSEAELAAFDAELAEDTAARTEIEEIEALAELLHAELGAEPTPALTEDQRKDLERKWAPPKRTRYWLPMAMAACVAMFVVAPVALYQVNQPGGDEKASPKTELPPAMTGLVANEQVTLEDGKDMIMGEQPERKLEEEADEEENRELGIRHNTEGYDHIAENDFIAVADDPRSTFSIDVDTGSYSNIRRFLNGGRLPPIDAVRIEEMINYFSYEYPQPQGEDPFSVNVEVGAAPWTPEHRLVRIGLKGREIVRDDRPSVNLVFLLDVSGSMSDRNKLPLLVRSFSMLVEQLNESDRVGIVVYAGASGVVLEPTPGNQRRAIIEAMERLQAGGSTNGASGIQAAYELARRNFDKDGTNRVILATDGDFNVGTTDRGSLIRLIEKEAASGVFLTVLGFGMGNYKDGTLEQLADKGNGSYGYIDTINEARKILVDQMSGTLFTIAKDVKIQVEFNPSRVSSYRLIGYENRALSHRDFNDDTKDAGEIGAGHTVTALYEIVPAGTEVQPMVDPLKYQPERGPADPIDELLTVKLRYKQPDGDTSKLIQEPVTDRGDDGDATADFRFASAVAGFGMLLRKSKHSGTATFDSILKQAEGARGQDDHGYRREFTDLVRKAAGL